MTESPVDVAAIKAKHRRDVRVQIFCDSCPVGVEWPCEVYRLADALDRAQAASEGVDLLIAQAERRGAVKALRCEAAWVAPPASRRLKQRADEIENGADL